jgi:hypothetical protein
MQKGWHKTLPLIAVLAVVTTLGCVPWYVLWGDQEGGMELCFTDKCVLAGSDGRPVGEIHVKTWERITFCNKSAGTVVVVFPGGRRWIGRDDFRLGPGERVTLRVRIAPPAEYSYSFYCKNRKGEATGNGGGPVVKDPPGGGGGG